MRIDVLGDSRNYKLNREMAVKIIEWRGIGYSFRKISMMLLAEYGIHIDQSSLSRFYKHYCKGTSHILPKNEVDITIDNKLIVDSTKSERHQSLNRLTDTKSKPVFDESIFEPSIDDLKDFL